MKAIEKKYSIILTLLVTVSLVFIGASCGIEGQTEEEVGDLLDINLVFDSENELAESAFFTDPLVTLGSLASPMTNMVNQVRYDAGDFCVSVNATVKNTSEEDLYFTFSAVGYDSHDEMISWSMSNDGPILGLVELYIPSQSSEKLTLILNYTNEIYRIEVKIGGYQQMVPSSSVELPKKIDWQEAEEIIGSPLPSIGYVPDGYHIQSLYLVEKTDQSAHFTIVITDMGLAESDELNGEKLANKILVYMNLYKNGQIGGLKLPGDRYEIGQTEGVLWEQKDTNELIWLFPYAVFPGEYEMYIVTDKDMSVDELLKIARSIE